MRPLQLHLLRDFTPLIDSQDLLVPLSSEFKVLVRGVGPLLLAFSKGSFLLLFPPSLVITMDGVRSGVGGGSSSPSPCVRGLVEGGGLWSYQYSGIEGSSSSSTEPRISCGGVICFWFVQATWRWYRSSFFRVEFFPYPCVGWPWTCGNGVFGGEFFFTPALIPGEEYFVDFLSRGWYLPTVWVLNRAVFRPIYRMFSSPLELVLFASVFNFRLPKYCSRCPDALAWKIDALSFSWSGLRLYAFFPYLFSSGSWTS